MKFKSDREADHSVSDVLTLGVAALYLPVLLRLQNFAGLPEWHWVLIGGIAVWALALAVAWLLVRLGTRRPTATGVVLVGVVLVTQGAPVYTWFPRYGILTVAAVLLVVATLLVASLTRLDKAHWFTYGFVIFLLIEWIAAAAHTVAEWGQSNVSTADEVSISLTHRPDVFLIVFDGLVGPRGWEEAMVDSRSWPLDLSTHGMSSPTSAWSSYPWTQTSLPSLLMMDYPVTQGVVNGSTRADLFNVISGENTTLRIFEDNGYETVMLESPWHGSSCGPSIDVCVRSGFFSETIYAALGRSILNRPVLETTGHAYSSGSIAAMEWLHENVKDLNEDRTPNFVFAHIMLPHPPFFVNHECNVRYDHAFSEFRFQRQSVGFSTRADGYEAQILCVERFMRAFLKSLDDSSVVIFLGDHGTDSRNQVDLAPERWLLADLVERFNIGLWIRTPGCDIDDTPIVIPNVMKHVFSCLGHGTALQLLPSKMFVHDISGVLYKLPTATVDLLLSNDVD